MISLEIQHNNQQFYDSSNWQLINFVVIMRKYTYLEVI